MDVLRPVRFVKGSGLCRFWFAQILPEKQSFALLIKLPIFAWLPRHIIGPNVLKKIIIGNCEHRIKEQKTAIFTHTETCDRHLIGWCFSNLHAPATEGNWVAPFFDQQHHYRFSFNDFWMHIIALYPYTIILYSILISSTRL